MALQAPQEDKRPIEERFSPDDGWHKDVALPALGEIDIDDPYGANNPNAQQNRDAIAQRNIADALASLIKDSMAACKIILERYPQQTAPQPSASPAELQHQ